MLYSTLAIPLALIADRTSRSWVITISLGVWSAFTALCGLATSFWQLFAFRIGVGVGEAGGVAPSYAMISDYFPPHKRAKALAMWGTVASMGIAAGVLFGGILTTALDWRAVFFVNVPVGAAVLAGVMRRVAPMPRRSLPPVAASGSPGRSG